MQTFEEGTIENESRVRVECSTAVPADGRKAGLRALRKHGIKTARFFASLDIPCLYDRRPGPHSLSVL